MKKLIPLLLLAACTKPYDPATSIQAAVDSIATTEEGARQSARIDKEVIRALRDSIREDCRKLWEMQRDHPACR